MTLPRAEDVLEALETFLGRLHCAAQNAGLDSLMAADLSFSQLRSLLVLAQRAVPVPIHELADDLRLSVASAGRNVDQLARAGLVSRLEDERDRRVKLVSLTAAGRELIAGFRTQHRSYALGILRAIGSEDRHCLFTALRSINSKMTGCEPHFAASSDLAPSDSLQESSR